ncbi:MAG: hypothetical protein MEQ07_12115, partial [Aquimonas sp.]|nr:hypothetical protein [Aquimonas sp.]
MTTMRMERRQFVGGLMSFGALALAGDAFAMARTSGRRLKRIGIQLYTLREVAKADPVGTLERLAQIGYREVELGGPPYATMDPPILRRELDHLGLAVPSMHVQMADLEQNLDGIVRQAQILGVRYVTLPWVNEDRRSTIAQCQQTAKVFDQFGARLRTQGLTFC